MLSELNIDLFLSDPMMMVGAGLAIFGFILFLCSIVKLATMGRKKKEFVVPLEEPELPPAPVVESTPEPVSEPIPEPIPEPPAPVAAEPSNGHEKTVVINPNEADLQMQLDIIVSQLKNLNRKVSEIEERIETTNEAPSTEAATLREPPVNPEDYSQKLLKLAEHVILLEKEVARLKGGAAKPPIMPL